MIPLLSMAAIGTRRRIIAALAAIALTASSFAANPPATDFEQACDLIDTLPIDRVEGLWRHEADDMTLLIMREPHSRTIYGVFVVESPDCRLEPGCRIGELEDIGDNQKFRMRIMSSWKKGMLGSPIVCAATLDGGSDRLSIESRSLKVSLSPSIVLPRLLDMLRLGVRIKINDPAEKLHDGWRKIYPVAPDGASVNAPRTIYL